MSIARTIVPVLVLTAVVAGCSGTGAGDDALLLRPARTAIPQGTSDPLAKPAVDAYEAFVGAATEAEKNPVAGPDEYPPAADFSRYSFDPARTEYQVTITELSRARQQFRGTPPQSDVRVTSIAAGGPPWPTVVLSDCRTGRDGWQLFDTGSDAVVPVRNPSVPAPLGATVTLIYRDAHWGVTSIVPDENRTCPG